MREELGVGFYAGECVGMKMVMGEGKGRFFMPS